MPALHRLPTRTKNGAFHVVVEAPRGSNVKLKYDPKLGVFTLARPLVLGVSYPYDWGFIPSTMAPDGDPLDAMVLLDAVTYPGVVLPCVPLGVVKLSQKRKKTGARERNDRIIAIPVGAPRLEEIRDARDLPERVRKEIGQFFLTAVVLADKDAKLLGWDGPEAANELIDASARAWSKAYPSKK
ncbi:MAG TPA: inorganic diphosphatase [Polyangiaceae bacterium]|jgi:inorganic pyrophosphatase|nr:inorganic diphosphatase [Polyangiaceae bacterium]